MSAPLTKRTFSPLPSHCHMSMSRTKSAAWTMVGVSLLAATAPAASAQVTPETPSTATIPVRDVTAPVAKATRAIGGANMLRALSDGSIFVNDVQRRQLLRFDPTLKTVVVVADTAPGSLMPYGQRPLGLLPYLGDSTIVVDPATLALVVLNKDGTTARVMASPRTNDVNTLSNMNLGSHAFDPQGRLYYRQGSAAGGAPGGMAMMFGSGNDRGGDRGGGAGGRGGNTQGRGAAPANVNFPYRGAHKPELSGIHAGRPVSSKDMLTTTQNANNSSHSVERTLASVKKQRCVNLPVRPPCIRGTKGRVDCRRHAHYRRKHVSPPPRSGQHSGMQKVQADLQSERVRSVGCLCHSG